MNKAEFFTQLLDIASEKAGSDYKLAKEIGISQAAISQWRHGKRDFSPEDAALMAEVAGLNAAEWMARVAIAKHEGTPKGEKLKSALKKALVLTGGVLVTSGANAASLPGFGYVKSLILYTMYSVVKLKKTNPV